MQFCDDLSQVISSFCDTTWKQLWRSAVKSIFALSLNRFTQVDVIGSTKVQLISEGEIIIDSEKLELCNISSWAQPVCTEATALTWRHG